MKYGEDIIAVVGVGLIAWGSWMTDSLPAAATVSGIVLVAIVISVAAVRRFE